MKNEGKKICYIAGIVVGIIVIILGVSVANMDIRTQYIDQAIFGADYYTESHAAMAAAANNIIDLIGVVQKGVSYVLYSIGLFDICYFVLKMTEKGNRKEQLQEEVKEELPEI